MPAHGRKRPEKRRHDAAAAPPPPLAATTGSASTSASAAAAAAALAAAVAPPGGAPASSSSSGPGSSGAKRARAAAYDDSSSSDSESDSESSSSESSVGVEPVPAAERDELVQLEFETRDPQEADYHSVKRALGPVLDRGDVAAWSVGDLADLVIAQTDYVGSLLLAHQSEALAKEQQQQKQGSSAAGAGAGAAAGAGAGTGSAYDPEKDVEPQVVGVVSVVNLQAQSTRPFVGELRTFLVDKLKRVLKRQRKRAPRARPAAGSAGDAQHALDLIKRLIPPAAASGASGASDEGAAASSSSSSSSTTESIGWLLSERLLNVPMEVAPPLIESLQKEIGWAIEYAQPAKSEYDVDFFLRIAVSQADKGTAGGADPAASEFVHCEDEVLREHATVAISWPLDTSAWTLNSPNTASYRWLLIIPKAAFPKAIDEMKRRYPASGTRK